MYMGSPTIGSVFAIEGPRFGKSVKNTSYRSKCQGQYNMSSQFRKGLNEQQKILRQLKKLSFQELSMHTDSMLANHICDELRPVIDISKSRGSRGGVSIAVSVETNLEEVHVPSWLADLTPDDVFIESARSIDGFEMLPNGRVLEMHPEDPEDFDDD